MQTQMKGQIAKWKSGVCLNNKTPVETGVDFQNVYIYLLGN